jgi:hypothetical protein
MSTWRDELVEAIKSKSEREAEELERKRKRLEEALRVADDALGQARDGLHFVGEQLRSKSQPCDLSDGDGKVSLAVHGQTLTVALARDEATIRVTLNEGRPRDFDFAKDRHLSPKDVEEYVGRRAVELARAAQKTRPW